MSSIGPQLPPHLAKRKRSPDDESPISPPSKATRLPNNNQDEIALGESDSEDDGYGPSAPQTAAAIGPTMPSSAAVPARPSIGPALPPSAAAATASDSDDSAGPAPPPPTAAAAPPPSPPKRAIRGPAPPPASLAERPNSPPSPSPSSSSSEDEYGPALPGAGPTSSHQIHPTMRPNAATDPEPDVPRRDDWMLAPPSAEPGYRERDPTKLRSRKFASGATATTRPRDGNGGISSIWTETPEEKARRLADAVLGRGGAGAGAGSERSQQQQQQSSSGGGAAGVSGIRNRRGGGGSGDGGSHRDEKIRAFTEQTRGKSLYEEHQSARKAGKSSAGGARKGGGEADEEDDDPSKRAFDREKDMGLGMKIDASKRKELLNRAADFGGRFSKGNYL